MKPDSEATGPTAPLVTKEDVFHYCCGLTLDPRMRQRVEAAAADDPLVAAWLQELDPDGPPAIDGGELAIEFSAAARAIDSRPLAGSAYPVRLRTWKESAPINLGAGGVTMGPAAMQPLGEESWELELPNELRAALLEPLFGQDPPADLRVELRRKPAEADREQASQACFQLLLHWVTPRPVSGQATWTVDFLGKRREFPFTPTPGKKKALASAPCVPLDVEQARFAGEAEWRPGDGDALPTFVVLRGYDPFAPLRLPPRRAPAAAGAWAQARAVGRRALPEAFRTFRRAAAILATFSGWR